MTNTITALSLLAGITLGSLAAQSTTRVEGSDPSLIYMSDAVSGYVNPFTHSASIPADADPATIRLKKVKTVKVLSRIKSSIDARYCEELQFRDPGGSMSCPSIQTEMRVPAYEVTYSFSGQPLPSDEYGNRSYTFAVYFRPEELPAALRAAFTAGRPDRSELEAYFRVDASRLPSTRLVIDEAASKFCAGNFVDGLWTHADTACRDQVSFMAKTVPSHYLTLNVAAVSPLPVPASLRALVR